MKAKWKNPEREQTAKDYRIALKILADINSHGGPEALYVRWARTVVNRAEREKVLPATAYELKNRIDLTAGVAPGAR